MPTHRAILVKTIVFDERLYTGRGDVHQWVNRVTTAYQRNAQAAAPVRTGRLKSRVKTDVRQVSRKRVVGRVGSTAHYTLYVIRGTKDREPIHSPNWPEDRHALMRLRPYGPWGRKALATVSGQHAQNFFLDAWYATAARHRTLAEMPVPPGIAHP